MRFLYNFFFLVFFLLSAPYYFLRMWRRGHWSHGFSQRFGRYSSKIKQAITNRHVIWIHAVSVGEVNICTQLIKALEPRVPNIKLVVSTTTSTGMGELNRRLPSHIQKIYYPIDRRKYVQRAIGTIHPEAMVLIEAEVWPNFLWQLAERRIPAFLINARLSEKSYRGYRRFGFLFRRLFAGFAGVGCQNEADAQRLRQLGCRPEVVQVLGSLKFDSAAQLEERRLLEVPALLAQLGVPKSARLLIGGSTHAGEEAVLAEIYARLRQRFPELFLVVVPRHFERGREAGKDVEARGLRVIYRKDITAGTQLRAGEADALVVNSTGELKYFYEHATVIFVGKSLTANGGQNPIEPAALGKAVVFGPNMENFADIAKKFVVANGAIQVKDAAELGPALAELLADEARLLELGRNAQKVVRDNQGAMDRTVDMIVAHLEGGEMYVAPKPFE